MLRLCSVEKIARLKYLDIPGSLERKTSIKIWCAFVYLVSDKEADFSVKRMESGWR